MSQPHGGVEFESTIPLFSSCTGRTSLVSLPNPTSILIGGANPKTSYFSVTGKQIIIHSILLLFYTIPILSYSQSDVPFYINSVKQDQSMGGINQNFRDLTNPGQSNTLRARDSVTGSSVPGDTCIDNPTFCVDATNHKVNLSSIIFPDGTQQTSAISGSSSTISLSTFTTVSWVNVKQFGALGNDSADDTSAIRQAIAFASTLTPATSTSTRQTVWFPIGIYKVTQTIQVPSYIKIDMDGVIKNYLSDAYAPVIWFSSYTDFGVVNVDAFQGSGVRLGHNAVYNDIRGGKILVKNVGTNISATPQFGIELQGYVFQWDYAEVYGGNQALYSIASSDLKSNSLQVAGTVNGIGITSCEHFVMSNSDIDTYQQVGIQIDSSHDINISGEVWNQEQVDFSIYKPFAAVLIGSYTAAGISNQNMGINLHLNVLNAGSTVLTLMNVDHSKFDLNVAQGPLFTTTFSTITAGVQYGINVGTDVAVHMNLDGRVTNPIVGSSQGQGTLEFIRNSTWQYLSQGTFITNNAGGIENKYGILTGTINVIGTATAKSFAGDGSLLTGLHTLGWITDNFIGQVNGVKTAFTLSDTPSVPAALQVVLDGVLQSPTSDYTYTSGTSFTMTSAPAANSSSFFTRYSTGATVASFVNTSSQAIYTAAFAGTNTTFGTCIGTLTVTTDGGPYRMIFSGNLNEDTNGTGAMATIYQDGGFISPWSQTVAMMRTNGITAGGTILNELNFNYYFTPSAGTHSWCIAFKTSVGGTNWSLISDLRPAIFRIESAK